MWTELRPALAALAFWTAVTGLAYPLAVTAIAQVAFADQANGSLVTRNGTAVGSHLIGQCWDGPRWFWGRPSAAACSGAASAASNLGPTNPALREAVRGRIQAMRAADASGQAPVPVDLVTTSGSGLDPDVTPAAARFQVARVARARGLPETQVRALVEAHVQGAWLGLLGEPRVNVLDLNLALEQLR
jgi:K+-transporting ATPase ATPase C chain